MASSSRRLALPELPEDETFARDTPATVLPVVLTSSMACSRNSGEYLLGRPSRTPSPGAWPKFSVSTDVGQLQWGPRLSRP